ncbi:hypothetical protein [Methylobacterium brachiatum]|uniref:hypothetical protein n=1 Tax=Methylobacterium brachiatum TaxID=269660 RepID=UPI00244CD5E8|nr:hypothetical protein [Methylobacterium brachiatum]MDH2313113.1 hypothetical protein [Methylobacterium brachiatum]
MSADPHRRGLLGLFATAPIAAAAGVQPASALGRARAMSLSLDAGDHFSAALSRVQTQRRGPGLQGIDAAIERAHPLDADTPSNLAQLAAGIDADPLRVLEQQAVEARAMAALSLAFPSEIAAYRSFGAPMRRRLYAELLSREAERLRAASEPPPMPPASPGPDA